VSTNNLWSGRFDAAPDADVFAYGKSLPVDKRLVEDDITGSAAWARALNKAGVLSDADVDAMVKGLEEIRAAVRANPELIAQTKAALAKVPHMRLRYVEGHAGHAGNERADELARVAVEARASSPWKTHKKV